MQLASTTATSTEDAVRNSPDWRSAAFDAINFLVSNGLCFSSGEIAALLRTVRPDLAFRVTGIGEYIRDLFYNQAIPCYDDGQGNPLSPIQVARVTQGKSRTPVGQTVFVYGPELAACEAHEFEVEIPLPPAQPGTVTTAPSLPGPVSAPALPAPTTDGDEVRAYVGKDGRCYLPRKIVDRFLQEAGIHLRYGDSLHVTLNGNTATVTAEAGTDSKPYSVWQTTGRLAFYGPQGRPLPQGAKYRVTVDEDAITVDLGRAV